MKMALVGCGYVADQYMKTLGAHPQLVLSGIHDANAERARAFSRYHSVNEYASMDEVLADRDVELVLNLTNPRSHFDVTSACLQAGKHVYSEKPMAMSYEPAAELAALAKRKGLYLGSAPCSVLGETAQTIWKAVREGKVGRVRLVQAAFHSGMIAPKMSPWQWSSESGAHWPAKDEFEVGCTYEHAGYILTWLAALFGPATSVTAFSSCQVPDKGIPVDMETPDFTVGCIEYADGVVAHVSCSLLAPREKSLMIVGDDGHLFTRQLRNDAAPVYVRPFPPASIPRKIEPRLKTWRGRLEGRMPWVPWSGADWTLSRKLPLVRKPAARVVSRNKPVDFLRGPAEMADAIREQRPCRLSAELGLHLVELIEALQFPERSGGRREIRSTFEPMEPLPWNA